MTDSRLSVPLRALAFSAELMPTGAAVPQSDGTTRFPFSMVARTNGIATHPHWGRCVHDFAGAELPAGSITVDYCHNPQDVVGYADIVRLAESGLEMSGQLVSLKPTDRAAEIAVKQKLGVPYEASILMDWERFVVEEIPEGFDVSVNGQTFTGPLTVFRKWVLWAVAICPYGSDASTRVEFDRELPAELAVTVRPGGVPRRSPVAPADGQAFLSAFGARGAFWFAEGRSFEEAQFLYCQQLRSDADAKSRRIGELSDRQQSLETELRKARGEYRAEVQRLKRTHLDEVKLIAETVSAFTGPLPLLFTGPQQPVRQPLPMDNLARFAASIRFAGRELPE